MAYDIRYSCICHIGNIRQINQDNLICDKHYINSNENNIMFHLSGIKSFKDNTVFGVFDGMGGEERGEVASLIAAKNASKLKISKNVISSLSHFCQKTNKDICNYVKNNKITSMGTTAAMLVFSKKGITLCNIGDSKVFLFSNGLLEQISKDHVEVSAFGVKPLLSQNLGIPPTDLVIEPYFARGDYNNNDIYLICSDGLTDMVSLKELSNILASKTINEAVVELLEKALKNGGRDNVSIILCKIERNHCCIVRHKHYIKEKEV